MACFLFFHRRFSADQRHLPSFCRRVIAFSCTLQRSKPSSKSVHITRTAEPTFQVFFFARNSDKAQEPRVIGTAFLQYTSLEWGIPVKQYRVAPVFLFKNEQVFGPDYWDNEKDGGSIVVVPPGTEDPLGYAIEQHAKTSPAIHQVCPV